MRENLLTNPPSHINIDLEKALKAINTNEFDEHFSRHLHGHKTITDYYDDLSWYIFNLFLKINQSNLSIIFLPRFCFLLSKSDVIN